jgi:hypothetical protein
VPNNTRHKISGDIIHLYNHTIINWKNGDDKEAVTSAGRVRVIGAGGGE